MSISHGAGGSVGAFSIGVVMGLPNKINCQPMRGLDGLDQGP